jgi:tetratricopeptide (TPR) repeat protein
LQWFPEAFQPRLVLGWATWCQGRTQDAVATFERALAQSREALSIASLGFVLARGARRDEALRLLRELQQLAVEGKAPPIALVVLHAGLGDAEAAFGWLETVFRVRADLQWVFTRFPGLDPLRADARFVALARRSAVAG